MSNYKSRGPDSITAEFYKIFWDDLKSFFLECVRFSCEKGNCQTCKMKALL